MKERKLLKDCPFCGEEAYLGDTWDGRVAVICCFCGCKTLYFKYKEDAMKAWNKRVSPQDTDKKK